MEQEVERIWCIGETEILSGVEGGRGGSGEDKAGGKRDEQKTAHRLSTPTLDRLSCACTSTSSTILLG
jgi:hypothetical protein